MVGISWYERVDIIFYILQSIYIREDNRGWGWVRVVNHSLSQSFSQLVTNLVGREDRREGALLLAAPKAT